MKKLFTLICSLTLFYLPCHAQISWSSPPVTISTPSVNASDPQVVTDTSGNVTAAWVENGVIQAIHMPFGGVFGPITSISNVSATSSNPRLGIDPAGNVSAIWVQNGVVNYSTLPAGGTWSAEVAISNTGASNPSIWVDSHGNKAAIWVRGGFIEAAQNPMSIGTWQPFSQLSSNGADDNPDIYIGEGGTILAVWHELVSGADQVFSAKGIVNGAWGSPVNIVAVTSGAHHNFPKVVVDSNGNATAAWYSYQVTGNTFFQVAVVTSSLTTSTSTWTSIIQLSEIGFFDPSKLFLRLGLDSNGNTIAIWVNSYFGNNNFTIESAVQPNGNAWVGPSALINSNLYAYQADLNVTSYGEAVTAFMFSDGTNINIQADVTPIDGQIQNFFQGEIISQGIGNANPRVFAQYSSTNNTVYAASVWINNNGTNNGIQAVTGVQPVVSPPTNLNVTEGSNNFGPFTEFFNTITWTQSVSSNITLYFIYRNGVLAASVPPSVTQYVDPNVVQNQAVTYGVAAVAVANFLSPIATVNFP